MFRSIAIAPIILGLLLPALVLMLTLGPLLLLNLWTVFDRLGTRD